MGRFTRAEDSMKAVARGDSLNLEDVLGIYLDLCDDVRDGGRSLEELAVQDTDKFLMSLSRMGRIYINIVRKHGDDLARIDVRGRIGRQESRISENVRKFSEEESLLAQSLAREREETEAQREREQELEARREQLSQARQTGEELEENCRKLEAEIRDMSQVDLTAVRERQQTILDRKAQVQTELDRQREREAELEKQLQALSDEKSGRDALLAEKEGEIARKQEETGAVTAEIGKRAEDYNRCLEDLRQKQDTRDSLKKKQSDLAANVVILQNDIDRLREHLKKSDAAELEQERDRLRRERQRVDEEISCLQAETGTERENLTARQRELEAEQRNREEQRDTLRDENTAAEKRLRDLAGEIEGERNRKERLTAQVTETEAERDRLAAWFGGLELRQLEGRLTEAEDRTRLYRKAQEALFEETEEDGLFQTKGEPGSCREVTELRDELKSQMREIEKQTERFRKHFVRVREIFED